MPITPLAVGAQRADARPEIEGSGATTTAALLDRHIAIRDLVAGQAETVQKLNERLGALTQEKTALPANVPTGQTPSRLAELDGQIASLTANLAVEMSRLQALAQKLTDSLDAASNAGKRFFDSSSGIVSNIR